MPAKLNIYVLLILSFMLSIGFLKRGNIPQFIDCWRARRDPWIPKLTRHFIFVLHVYISRAFPIQLSTRNTFYFLLTCVFCAQLMAEFKRLGSRIVFADFFRVIISTKKRSVEDALAYVEYVKNAINAKDIFHTIVLDVNKVILRTSSNRLSTSTVMLNFSHERAKKIKKHSS